MSPLEILWQWKPAKQQTEARPWRHLAAGNRRKLAGAKSSRWWCHSIWKYCVAFVLYRQAILKNMRKISTQLKEISSSVARSWLYDRTLQPALKRVGARPGVREKMRRAMTGVKYAWNRRQNKFCYTYKSARPIKCCICRFHQYWY